MIGVGSSPLTRGKLRRRNVRARPPRLIPAHAGKTIRPHYGDATTTAHPRSRGENRATGPPARTAKGSSPLTRGKRDAATASGYIDGLIPAHAGKTTAEEAPRER